MTVTVAALAALLIQSSDSHWFDTRLDRGWTFLIANTTGESAVLTREGPRHSMIWARTENETPHNGTSSSMALYEARCSDGMLRQLQYTAYAEPNLEGKSRSSDTPLNWTYPGPGTIGQAIFDRACGLEE